MNKNIDQREHFAHFRIARFSYYEGVLAFDKLKIGEKVQLKLEPNNGVDKNAVEIYFEKHKLGYVPKDENIYISKLLKSGIDYFDARIQWVDGESYPEGQVGVIVYLIGK